MQSAGDQLFAGPGFAGDQNRLRGSGNGFDVAKNRKYGRALRNDVGKAVGFVRAID